MFNLFCIKLILDKKVKRGVGRKEYTLTILGNPGLRQSPYESETTMPPP